jgi:pimeloyl-ACP methyl ester carboxylesterase
MKFMLIHGAWHGGWCWDEVADRLEDEGADVFAPTLKGLSERAGELDDTLDLNTHIDEVADWLRNRDDIILVGHSYGGAVTLAALDRAPTHVEQLILLDAVVPEPGKTLFDIVPADAAERRRAEAEASPGGLTFNPLSPERLGLNPDQAGVLEGRVTGQPVRTYQTPFRLKGKPGAGKPLTYITCTDPVFLPLTDHRARAEANGWDVIELATGHDAMISDPDATAALLLRLARDKGGA